MAELRIGTSGWNYPDWIGNFYPEATRPVNYLRYYSRSFTTVELDTTFYMVPTCDIVRRWAEKVTSNFVFAAKFPRKITHEKRFEHCASDVHEFIEAVSQLEVRLGPLLIQLPYGFKATEFETLRRFLGELPPGYRYALEAQHRSWFTHSFFELLKDINISIVHFEHPFLPRIRDITSDFVYIRWLGDRQMAPKSFERPTIDQSEKLSYWAKRIQLMLERGLDVYGYFNNNFTGHAPSAVWHLEDLLANRTPRPQTKAIVPVAIPVAVASDCNDQKAREPESEPPPMEKLDSSLHEMHLL